MSSSVSRVVSRVFPFFVLLLMSPMAALSEKENPIKVLLAPEAIREDKKRKKASKTKLETSTSFKKEEFRMANTGPPESSSSVPGSSRSKKRKKVSKTEDEEQKELADSSLFSLEDSTGNVKKKKKKKKKEEEEEVKLVEEQVRETEEDGRISVNSNLELVQALRQQTTTSERKVELVMEFIEAQSAHNNATTGAFLDHDGGDHNNATGWMKAPQVASFVFNWVEMSIIQSSKSGLRQHGLSAHFDPRYWSILKWCLSSGYLHQNTSISQGLMRQITAILVHAGSGLSSCSSAEKSMGELMIELVEVVRLLLSVYVRSFRADLDNWVSLTTAALALFEKNFGQPKDHPSSLEHLIAIIVETFVRTVTSHPNSRLVFQVTVARLLEPLLTIVGRRGTGSRAPKKEEGPSSLQSRIVKAAKEILAVGLFHPSLVQGFSEVCTVLRGVKGMQQEQQRVEGKRNRSESYHMALFQKLRNLKKDGNLEALKGLGFLFKEYAFCLRAQQMALFEDVFGVRGQGKLQPDGDITGNNPEVGKDDIANKKSAKEAVVDKTEETTDLTASRKHGGGGGESEAVFHVFAELLSPIIMDLQQLVLDMGHDGNESGQHGPQLLQMHSLLQAVNSLLEAGNEVNAYKPIEDTPGLTYFNFLQEVHNSVISVGMTALLKAKSPSSPQKKNMRSAEPGGQKEIGILSQEVISALHHLVELEYHVFEEKVANLWTFVFQMLGLDTSSSEAIFTEALKFGCRLLDIYSDLRQVDIPIFYLCVTLRSLRSSLPFKSVTDCVEKFVCAKPFLATMGMVVLKLPEGQIMQFLKKLSADISETLKTFDDQEDEGAENNIHSIMKGLTELYICSLNNVNVTVSFSLLAGRAVNDLLINVLSPSLKKLVDGCLEDVKQVKDPSDTDEEEPQIADGIPLAWRSVFLLRLFAAARSLHRQCVSLMAPKAAKTARAKVFEPVLDLTAHEAEIIALLKGSGFFSPIQRGHVKVSKVVKRIEKSSGGNVLDWVPELQYTLNLIVLQSLVDLHEKQQAVKFLSGNNGSTKRFAKLLRSIHREGTKLVAFLLKGLNDLKPEVYSNDVHKLSNRMGQESSCGWDSVVATLTSTTLPVARWRLFCQTTDVWSSYASEDHLKQFVTILLQVAEGFRAKIGSFKTEGSAHICMEDITLEVLTSVAFFENEDLRKVFASAFLEEVKRLSLRVFKCKPLDSHVVDQRRSPESKFLEWAVLKKRLKAQMGSQEPIDMSSMYSRSPNWTESWTGAQLEEFGQLIRLIGLLSLLPSGYLHPLDTVQCSSVICGVEKLLVDSLQSMHHVACCQSGQSPQHEMTEVPSLPGRFFIAICACHNTLKCLVDMGGESQHLSTFFSSAKASHWLLFVPQIVASYLLDEVFKGSYVKEQHHLMDDWIMPYHTSGIRGQEDTCILYTLLMSTCAIIESTVGKICNLEVRSLLCPKSSTEIPSVATSKTPLVTQHQTHSSKSAKKQKKLRDHRLVDCEEPLIVLCSVLLNRAHKLKKIFLQSRGTSSQWYEMLVPVAAISSFLWSMTLALESLDEECRNSKTSPLVWKTELPETWLLVIEEVEQVLVQSLLQALVPEGAKGFQFFTQSGIQSEDEGVDISVVKNMEETEFGEVNQKDAVVGEHLMCTDEAPSYEEMLVEQMVENLVDEEEVLEDEGKEKEPMQTEFDIHFLEREGMDIESFGGISDSAQVSLLQSILEGKMRERSELVGELFIAMAALVRLRSLFFSPFASFSNSASSAQLDDLKTSPPPSMNDHLGAAFWLLSGAAQQIQSGHDMDLNWVVGVVKYVDAVGSFLPCMRPFIAPLDFLKLVDLHLILMGVVKSYSKNPSRGSTRQFDLELEKRITTGDWDSSHAQSFWMLELGCDTSASETCSSKHLAFALSGSFERLLRFAPRHHMVLALQSIEKAMAGVWVKSNPGDGLRPGQAGAVVAAGVDCLGIALHAVSGKTRLHLLANHCPTFFGALFNLIVHLQRPSLFIEEDTHKPDAVGRSFTKVNSVSVVLQSLEVLIRLASRAVIFPMRACHVALGLQCPASLFRPFCEKGMAKLMALQNLHLQAGGSQQRSVTKDSFTGVFSENVITLYVACCRLLCALLRHHLRECGHSMALLGESARVLLQCLTAPNWAISLENVPPSVSTVASAAHCASWLRRVYEEMGEHKETMGKYCCHILADYLNVLSGYGASGVSLNREVDSALRPGAYALLDACSTNDLQQLHAAFGEGGRRSALMTLRRDYDLHFKYTGKV